MNIRTTLLAEIAALSIDDRIHVVQEIWDGIAAEQAYPDLTATQKREIDRRIDESDMNPDNTLSCHSNFSWSARSEIVAVTHLEYRTNDTLSIMDTSRNQDSVLYKLAPQSLAAQDSTSLLLSSVR